MQHKRSSVVVPSIALLLLWVTFCPTALAGTPDDPEMPDQVGDVDVVSLMGLKPEEAAHVQTNLSMFDLTRAFVLAENPTGFWVRIDVHDLSGGLESPDPTVPLLPMYGAFETHFAVSGAKWFARAQLEAELYTDTEQQPPAVLPMLGFNFTLHKDDLQQTYVQPLMGAVSPLHDAVFFHIPKEAIGSPATGDAMTGLFTVSRFQQAPLDYAPDPVFDPTSVDPDDPLGSTALPDGAEYRFGQYPGSGAPSVLRLTPDGETTLLAERGTPLEIRFEVENLGDQDLEVRLGTARPYGWTVDADTASLSLAAGETETVGLTVTPGDRARATTVFKVSAATSTETQSIAYLLQLADAEGGTPGPTDAEDEGPTQSLSDSDAKGAPMAGGMLVLGASVGLVAFLRRRS